MRLAMTCGGERVFVCRQLPATTIPHQAAPEENGRGSLSLELPFGHRYYAVPCGLKNHGMSQLGIGVGVCSAAQLHVTINSALGPRYEEFRPRTICSRQPSRNASRFRNSGRRRSWESSWRLGSRRRFKDLAVLAALPILYYLLLRFAQQALPIGHAPPTHRCPFMVSLRMATILSSANRPSRDLCGPQVDLSSDRCRDTGFYQFAKPRTP
jgi:hypothetical protein